jgi:hypothetical protein
LAGLKKKLKALKAALKKSDGETVVLANKEPKNEKARLPLLYLSGSVSFWYGSGSVSPYL